MRKLKRIFAIVFSVLLIFTVLCTSVFGASDAPFFPFPDGIDNKYLYAPATNLQSMAVPGFTGTNNGMGYYSLFSPYSLYTDSPLAGWALDESKEFLLTIGRYRQLNGSQVDYNVTSRFDYHSAPDGIGPYTINTVTTTTFPTANVDLVLSYGQCVLPLKDVPEYVYPDAYVSNPGNPFWTVYEMQHMLWYGDAEDVSFRFDISADVMGFRYSYESQGDDKFYFEEAPCYTKLVKSVSVPLGSEINDYLYNVTTVRLYDLLSYDAQRYMVDTTSSSSIPFEYVVFDNIQVSITTELENVDTSELYFMPMSFSMRDYFYENTDSDVLEYYPDIAQASDYFSNRFPCYTLPEEYRNLDFSYFLKSVGSIFDIELIGDFSLSDLLFSVLGIGMVIWFIKMFAGG